jgi:hypothetical protein
MKSISGVLVGLFRFIWARAYRWRSRKGFGGGDGDEAEGRARRRHRLGDVDSVGSSALDVMVSGELERQKRERELYERFLRGEEISDDDEDAAGDDDLDYDLAAEEEDGSESMSDAGDIDGTMIFHRAGSVFTDDADPQERQEEAIALFTDLVRSEGVGEGSRLVWSHLARTTGRDNGTPAPPLTRRRWGQMGRRWGLGLVDDSDVDVWEVDESGSAAVDFLGGDGAGFEVDWTERAMCIICTSRPRDIVSWPCR